MYGILSQQYMVQILALVKFSDILSNYEQNITFSKH